MLAELVGGGICLKRRVKGDGRREKGKSAEGKVRQSECRDRAGTQKIDTFTSASSSELTERAAEWTCLFTLGVYRSPED